MSLTEGKTRGGNGAVKEYHKKKFHIHLDENGFSVRCYHDCKNQIKQPSFWILLTLTFPIEHGIWTLIYRLFGLEH